MDNRVYYGEYSLKHWIDLMLKRNIVLPNYQRHFVWSEEDVKTLIKTMEDNLFVPPITIGAFQTESQNKNLILDGQQRLTSILLAYIGRFPNENTFMDKSVVNFADENGEDEDKKEENKVILKWTFEELIREGKTKEEIIRKITDINYRTFPIVVSENFFEETFLGFSYLVPYLSNEQKQQKFYSTVFRHINDKGTPLLPQESRQSLYYLNGDLSGFFDPLFFHSIIIGATTRNRADFVRYLALLSQYFHDGSPNGVARGYKSYMEDYYAEYIAVVADDTDSIFGKFSEIFPDKNYKDRIEVLEKTCTMLAIPKSLPSIIYADIWFFGLIYTIVIENKRINEADKAKLKDDVQREIDVFKNDSDHARSPNQFKYLRDRIATSIKIYEKYAKK